MAKAKAKAVNLNLSLLASIVAAGANGMFIAPADSAPFTSHNPPLVEVNTEINDGNGNLATRATQAGIEYSQKNPPAPQTAGNAAPASPKLSFNIVTTELPDIKRGHGGAATSKYPFDQLPAATKNAEGKIIAPSFFIPASDDMPEPAKTLASTVSSATRRYAVQDKNKPKKTVMRVPEGAPEGSAKVAVEIDNMLPTRQFVIRAVEDGAQWGQPGTKGAAVYRIDLGEHGV